MILQIAAVQMVGASFTGTADSPGQNGNGLDLWVLFGSIALFLAIVVVITLLRRWR